MGHFSKVFAKKLLHFPHVKKFNFVEDNVWILVVRVCVEVFVWTNSESLTCVDIIFAKVKLLRSCEFRTSWISFGLQNTRL